MNSDAYAVLVSIRREFRSLVDAWSVDNPYLLESQERLRVRQGYDDYRVETPVVYNRALDDLGVTGPQFVVLTLVGAYPGLSNADLARLSHLTPHGAGRGAWYGLT